MLLLIFTKEVMFERGPKAGQRGEGQEGGKDHRVEMQEAAHTKVLHGHGFQNEVGHQTVSVRTAEN